MPAVTTERSIDQSVERSVAHFVVRRVVVALDAQCDNRGALAAAREFAGRWRVNLSGVFVIGTDLLHLSGLPGVRQTCLSWERTGPLAGSDLEADLALLEGRARRGLAAAARLAGVESSFAVARGGFPSDTIPVGHDDLLVVEGLLRPFGGRFAVENRWRRVAEQARHPVLLIRRQAAGPGPVACFHDGSEAADRALAAALRLADERGQPLVVLSADPPPDLDAWRGNARPPRLVRVAGAADDGWARAAAAVRPTLLVVPAGMPAARWAAVADADVLLMR